MIDLSKLKNVTENITVLHVEDSAILLKRMSAFLQKIFKEVYTAENGEIGLEMYQKNQPDLVITDLNMPVMDGHTMILNLKKINPDVNIIIVSAYSDTDNLLKSIHLGISDFIPKPVDNKLLLNILFKVCSKIGQNLNKEQIKIVNNIDNSLNENHNFLMKKFEIIFKSHIPIEFLNHYKGVPIIDRGKIVNIDTNSITVTVPYLQSLAIKHAGNTIIESELLDIPIKATLVKIHSYNDSLVLSNLTIEKNIYNKRKQLMVIPNDELEINITHNNQHINYAIDMISEDLITLFITSDNLSFQEGDEVTLEFSLHFIDDKDLLISEKFTVKGEIYSIEENTETFLVTIIFQLKDLVKEYLEKYIAKRRLELIVEFKQLKKI